MKGIESSTADVIVVAKSQPRSYATPTIPTCQINLDITALVRADIDCNGMDYLKVTSTLMDIFQHWQRCYCETHGEFSVPNQFDCTGFQLGSGSFALDATGKTWQYAHSATVFGVVIDNY